MTPQTKSTTNGSKMPAKKRANAEETQPQSLGAKRTRRSEALAAADATPSKAAEQRPGGKTPSKASGSAKKTPARNGISKKAEDTGDQYAVRSILRAKIVGTSPTTGEPVFDYMVDWDDLVDKSGKTQKFAPTYEKAADVSTDLISEFWLSMKGSAIHRSPRPDYYDDYEDGNAAGNAEDYDDEEDQ